MKIYDLSDFSIELIDALLNKYEKSRIYKGTNIRQSLIFLKSTEKPFYHYFLEDSYLYKDKIDLYCSHLERDGLINILKNGSDIIKVSLNLDNLDKAYEFINKTNPNSYYERLKSYILSLNSESLTIKNYLNDILAKINKKDSLSIYFKSLDELKTIIKGIKEIEGNHEEILLRNFSKRIFSDSKYLENNIDKYIKIFNKYGDYYFESKEEFLENFNIFLNPSYSFIKNGLVFKINNQIIDLNKLNHEFSLSEEEIDELEIIDLSLSKVITIENLTTFNYFDKKDYLVIYLSGFSNKSKVKLLKKLNGFKKLSFYHFGDIDCGGIEIFINLSKKVGVSFSPYLMDIDTLERYKSFALNLTENDKKRLNYIKEDKNYLLFNNLISYMLLNNIKLEQEAIKKEDFY